jgi:chemotaxis signal transduction protein
MAAMARRAGRERPRPVPDPETLERLLGAWDDGVEPAAAAPPPAQPPPRPAIDGRLLRCTIGDGAYAFPLSAVAEVVAYARPRRLPGQAADAGVTILRGRVLPALDAAARLGIGGDRPPKRMVVVATPAGDHAVAVADAHDILEVDPARLSEPPAGAAASPFVAALVDIDGEVVVVLDPERLCAMPGT